MSVHADEQCGEYGASGGMQHAVISVRPASEGDIDALHRVDRLVFGRLAYPYFALRQLMDVHVRHCVVADEGSRLIGYCLGALALRPRVGWILGLGVLPEFRGAGYGRMLVAEAVRRVVADGAGEVRIFVAPENSVAIHVYERLGFRVRGLRPDYFGPEADRLIMTNARQHDTPGGGAAPADERSQAGQARVRPSSESCTETSSVTRYR